jgi:hypothetical protein
MQNLIVTLITTTMPTDHMKVASDSYSEEHRSHFANSTILPMLPNLTKMVT